MLLPSFTKKRLDLAKAKKWQLALFGYRLWITKKALNQKYFFLILQKNQTMIKNLILLSITVFLFGCNQNKEKSKSINNTTSNSKSIIFTDSTTTNKVYKHDEIISINRLACYKKDSTLITGEVKYFHENGQVKQVKTFKDGKLDGARILWDLNGKLTQEGAFKNGKIIGARKVWYDNGQLRGEGTYKDGKLDGSRKGWWKNGQLKSEANYKQGKLDGVSKTYTEEGILKEEKKFKDGKIIN